MEMKDQMQRGITLEFDSISLWQLASMHMYDVFMRIYAFLKETELECNNLYF